MTVRTPLSLAAQARIHALAGQPRHATTPRPVKVTEADYRAADTLLREHMGDPGVAALRCWLRDTRPVPAHPHWRETAAYCAVLAVAAVVSALLVIGTIKWGTT